MSEKVCAIVVTYNRKDLLMDCINSILSQTRQVEGICIVDNNSTDGTPKALYEKGLISSLPPEVLSQPWMNENLIQNSSGRELVIHYIRNNINTGGAGGFNLGIKKAFKHGYNWFWLMDDDVYADKDALKILLNCYKEIRKYEQKIGFLCSHVVWEDGSPNIMNLPQPTMPTAIGVDKNPYNFYIKNGILRVFFCSFVSCLIPIYVIKEVGLPIKEMFIYGDDLEYTSRIVNRGFCGLYVFKSEVFHRTKYNDIVRIRNFSENELSKIYFAIRNNIYNNRKKGILFLLRFLCIDMIDYIRDILKKKDIKATILAAKGIISGLVFSPKIEKINDVDNF